VYKRIMLVIKRVEFVSDKVVYIIVTGHYFDRLL
jgi:hypothetical protein